MTARLTLAGPGLTWMPDALLASFCADRALALATAAERLSAGFAFVPAGADWAADAAVALSGRGVVPVWACSGPFGHAAALLGWEAVQLELARHPDSATEILSLGADRMRSEVQAAVRGGAAHLVIADDLVVPGAWLVTPSVARRAVALAGAIIDSVEGVTDSRIFHTDGDPAQLVGVMSSAGFVAVHTALTGAGLATVADRSAPLAVLGGVSSRPTPDSDQDASVLTALASGRLVPADDGGIADEESFERVRRAFGRAAWRPEPRV